jgi:hypothetical protein
VTVYSKHRPKVVTWISPLSTAQALGVNTPE